MPEKDHRSSRQTPLSLPCATDTTPFMQQAPYGEQHIRSIVTKVNARRTQAATGPKRPGAETATIEPLRFVVVGAVNCRSTVRRRDLFLRAVGVAMLLGAWTSVAFEDGAGAAGSATPT